MHSGVIGGIRLLLDIGAEGAARCARVAPAMSLAPAAELVMGQLKTWKRRPLGMNLIVPHRNVAQRPVAHRLAAACLRYRSFPPLRSLIACTPRAQRAAALTSIASGNRTPRCVRERSVPEGCARLRRRGEEDARECRRGGCARDERAKRRKAPVAKARSRQTMHFRQQCNAQLWHAQIPFQRTAPKISR